MKQNELNIYFVILKFKDLDLDIKPEQHSFWFCCTNIGEDIDIDIKTK